VPASAAVAVPPSPSAPKPPEALLDGVSDPDDFGEYDVSAEPAAAPAAQRVVSFGSGGMCPSCQAALERSAQVCVACGYDLRTGTRPSEVIIETEASPITDGAVAAAQPVPAAVRPPVGLPPRIDSGAIVEEQDESWLIAQKGWEIVAASILIPLGIVLTFAEVMRYGEETRTFLQALPGAGTALVANIGLMLAAVFVAAMVVEDAFVSDPWWRIVLKVAAIGLAPGPLGTIVGAAIGDINGDIASVFTSIILYAVLFSVLFRWNVLHMAACVLVIWVIRTGVMYALFKIEGIRSNSWV
jgi:hypothetical protein